MLSNLIDRMKLPFRKDKELYLSLRQIIGFYPHDISFYKLALMHKSMFKRNAKGKPVNNERLEFLGDAILDATVGDISEAKAIKEVFGDDAYRLNISSTKSMTGHLLGAAGAVEALACVKSIQDDIVPPTINHAEGDDDPDIDYKMNYTFNKAQKREVRAALSNTFGFGGHNACVIFKKYAE